MLTPIYIFHLGSNALLPHVCYSNFCFRCAFILKQIGGEDFKVVLFSAVSYLCKNHKLDNGTYLLTLSDPTLCYQHRDPGGEANPPPVKMFKMSCFNSENCKLWCAKTSMCYTQNRTPCEKWTKPKKMTWGNLCFYHTCCHRRDKIRKYKNIMPFIQF